MWSTILYKSNNFFFKNSLFLLYLIQKYYILDPMHSSNNLWWIKNQIYSSVIIFMQFQGMTWSCRKIFFFESKSLMLRRSWLILLYIINQWFQYSSKISGGLWKFPREEDFLGALQKCWVPLPLIWNSGVNKILSHAIPNKSGLD